MLDLKSAAERQRDDVLRRGSREVGVREQHQCRDGRRDAAGGKPEVILIGCGSEVGLCMKAWEQLTAEGIKARVVSMPSWPLFDAQGQAYRESVLPPEVGARVAVEEASPIGWDRYVGRYGTVLGMSTFGESAPMKVVMEHFGFTVEHVVATAKKCMADAKAAN